jgi:hypothetical protein
MRRASGSAIASSTTAKEAAEHVDRLRRQADMGHHRNAALAQIMNGLGHAGAAFQLDGAALGLLDHLGGVVEGLRRALLIGAEWHVDDHQRPLRPAHDRPPMHDHQLERHRQCGLEAMHHHAERIADQQEIDMGVGNSCRMGMIRSERNDRLASLAGADLGGRGPRRRSLNRHRNSP